MNRWRLQEDNGPRLLLPHTIYILHFIIPIYQNRLLPYSRIPYTTPIYVTCFVNISTKNVISAKCYNFRYIYGKNKTKRSMKHIAVVLKWSVQLNYWMQWNVLCTYNVVGFLIFSVRESLISLNLISCLSYLYDIDIKINGVQWRCISRSRVIKRGLPFCLTMKNNSENRLCSGTMSSI